MHQDDDVDLIELAHAAPFEKCDIRFIPVARTLEGLTGPLTIEPRVMQLLVALAAAAGDVVPRTVLVARCWGTVVVGEDSLNRAVAGARKALRAAGDGSLRIETIPKIGYRLTADPAANVDLDIDHRDAVSNRAAETFRTPDDGFTPDRRAFVSAAGAIIVGGGIVLWRRTLDTRAEAQVRTLINEGEQAMRLALPEADRQGAAFLEDAVRRMPDHAEAWGKLALARRQIAEFVPSGQLAKAVISATDAAQRALAIDPTQADAQAALALLTPLHGNWRQAELNMQDVLRSHPNHLPTLDALAYLLAGTGVIADHYPMRLRTVRADPFHAGYNFRAIYSHWMNGDLAAADRAGERGLELWPRHFATWLARQGLFTLTGRAERALQMLEATDSMPDLPPPLAAILKILPAALASGRPADRALASDRIVGAATVGGPLMAVQAIMGLCALGEADRAFDVAHAYLLERGPLITGTAWHPGQPLHNDVRRRMTNFLFTPPVSPMRSDQRFVTLMQDLGLAGYWRQSGRRPDYLGNHPLP